MLKKQLTESEIKAKKELATFNRRFAGYKRTLLSDIEKEGLR